MKDVEEVLKALEIIDRHDTARTTTAYTLTGGAITSHLQGRDEADFDGQYAEVIEERFPGRWTGKVVAQALPKADVQRFHDYGVHLLHVAGHHPALHHMVPGAHAPLGRTAPDGAPLEHHIRLLDAYRSTMEEHGLSSPPGYGPAGPGRAVFSGSSFRDGLPARE